MSRPPRVVCFGECMLELQGEAFGTLRQTFGGDTLNTAVYLARCGRRAGIAVDYATALGDDSLSAGMMARWRAEGIGLSLVQRLPGRLPGLYLIEVDARGERRFSYWRDQAAARAYFEADTTPLEEAAGEIDALCFSGISLAILLPPAASACWPWRRACACAAAWWLSTTTTARACGPRLPAHARPSRPPPAWPRWP
jgi:2-dehydro-3-deoxygluconokinase